MDGLDVRGLRFGPSVPAATGRPPYDPRDLLKLYLYGYLNDVRSSRRLEREWLRITGASDFSHGLREAVFLFGAVGRDWHFASFAATHHFGRFRRIALARNALVANDPKRAPRAA